MSAAARSVHDGAGRSVPRSLHAWRCGTLNETLRRRLDGARPWCAAPGGWDWCRRAAEPGDGGRRWPPGSACRTPHAQRVLVALRGPRGRGPRATAATWSPRVGGRSCSRLPPIDLLDCCASAEARTRMVEDAVVGRHRLLDIARDDDRSAYALGVSFDPESAHAVELLRTAHGARSGAPRAAREGRHLPRARLRGRRARCAPSLQLYPRLRGGRRRAQRGPGRVARGAVPSDWASSDRMEVVHGDAAAFDRPDAFDFAFWSQFFFAEMRARTRVAVLHRSLRSGGIVSAPLMARTDVRPRRAAHRRRTGLRRSTPCSTDRGASPIRSAQACRQS